MTENVAVALPAFLCLAAVGLDTIYTTTEVAPHSLLGRSTSWATDFMPSDYRPVSKPIILHEM